MEHYAASAGADDSYVGLYVHHRLLAVVRSGVHHLGTVRVIDRRHLHDGDIHGSRANNYGYGSAVAVVIFVISLVIALTYQHIVMNRDLDGALTDGKRGKRSRGTIVTSEVA